MNNDYILDKKKNRIYTILFFIGVAVATYNFHLVAITIVRYRIPFSIGFLATLIGTYVDRHNYKNTYNFDFNILRYFFSFIQNTLIWGALAVFLFLGINCWFAEKEYNKREFDIVKKEKYFTRSRKGNRTSVPGFIICVEYKSTYENLVFLKVDHNDFDKINSVSLDIKEGFFGYLIYKNQRINWKD